MATRSNVNLEEIKVEGRQLIEKVRDIIEEGNARRVTIKKDDRVLLEFPLSVGFGGATAAVILSPTLAAVGALAALVTDVKVIVERETTTELIVPDEAQPDEPTV